MLLGLVADILIKLGDAVIFIIKSPLKIIVGEPLFPRIKLKRKVRSGTFKIRRPTKKVIFSINIKSCVNNFRVLIKPIIFPVSILFALVKFASKFLSQLIIFIFKAPVRIFHLYQINSERAKIRKLAKMRKESRIKNGTYKPSLLYKLKYVFIGFFLSFIFLFIPLISFLFVSELPNPSNLSVNYIPKTTKIYDRNGKLLYEIFANQNRTILKLSEVPKSLQDATIAIEDKDFYNHPGFDLRGIARAFVTNIKGEGFQGGSTITQQLIKSAFLTPDPTIIRKAKEVVLAFWAERIYTKDQILELYLNYVPYGGTAWGAQSAAEIYFGKKISDLTLAESAFLAGLPRAPSLYSPFFGNGEQWRKRQKEVLDAMDRLGYVSREEAKNAYEGKLIFRDPKIPIKAPHFVMFVRRILVDRFGLSEVERGGLQVVTSLDLTTQEETEKIVADEVEANTYLNIGNGAALITNPRNGDILSMVGSKNYFDQENDGNVNLTTSLRQPGSSIKVVTYSLALSQGYTEATILDDTPLTITNAGQLPYTPVNYDGVSHGKIPLRTAFANSFNIPAVRIAQKLGPASIKEQGKRMGISSWNNAKNYGVSITLGGLDVRMTEMATTYGTIANGGKRVDLDPILVVRDSYGKTIYKKEAAETPVVDEGIAFIISDILADNNARRIEFGLNTPLEITGRRVSVKTGTTDSKRDNWAIGFTSDIVVATWVGNNDNTPMNQALASGITGAAPMWNKIMTVVLDKIGTPSSIIIPANIVQKFCLGQDRYFIKGTESSVSCVTLPSAAPSPSP